MPNMQLVLTGMTPTQQVACAIYCCNKKPYNYTKGRDARRTCQTVGNRKHSCVVRNLRKSDAKGKRTKANRDDNVVASPPGQKIPKRGPNSKTRKPDVLINDGGTWKIIDAKFPCSTEEINDKIGTNPKPTKKAPKGVILGATGIAYDGDSSRAAEEMMGGKEENYYPRYEVNGKPVGEDNVRTMTPQEANDEKGNCTCETVGGGNASSWTSEQEFKGA